MYKRMLSDKTSHEINGLKFLVQFRRAVGLPRIPNGKIDTPELMISRFLRKEMGVSGYGDLIAELGTRLCNDSKHRIVEQAKLSLPEYKKAQYDPINNIITLEKGTKIFLNTGVVQSGVERYMKCRLFDQEQCDILRTIRVERLVRDELAMRNKRRAKAAEKQKTM